MLVTATSQSKRNLSSSQWHVQNWHCLGCYWQLDDQSYEEAMSYLPSVEWYLTPNFMFHDFLTVFFLPIMILLWSMYVTPCNHLPIKIVFFRYQYVIDIMGFYEKKEEARKWKRKLEFKRKIGPFFNFFFFTHIFPFAILLKY